MTLSTLDWSIIFGFFAISLTIGILVARQAGKSTKDFFLSGRNMPWWLLGVSMVATTFSADTPNLVTDIVRQNGVAGNWVWWAFLLTGMLTTFIYAKLWNRSKVMTDLEFYTLRYGGKSASFLRGFRAIYLGVLFNVVVMATVCLAAAKIGQIMLGIPPIQTLLLASVITIIYSSLGGLKAVILTDFFQFILAMVGTIWAANYILDLPEINGLENMLSHENVRDKLDLIPSPGSDMFWTIFILPIAIQWWSAWYPGAEPGGGGYIAQRMLSAKSESHAIKATLFFNLAHYALRPWPWIIIALASLVMFPDLESIKTAFPHAADLVGHDIAYPAMLTYLPKGLIGLVIASIIAAFMSTISTHLNWGSSYIVNDFYQRFIKEKASEKELVWVGRISSAVLMLCAIGFALLLKSAKEAFEIIIIMGAGTGLLFILRWFWWRINVWSEVSAMLGSLMLGLYWKFWYAGDMGGDTQLLLSVAITTVIWVLTTFLTKPEEEATLRRFYRLTQPGGPGWKKFREHGVSEAAEANLPVEVLAMLVGSFMVYSTLFGIGYLVYGTYINASIALGIAGVSAFILFRLWGKLRFGQV